jgi:hypothetical protein
MRRLLLASIPAAVVTLAPSVASAGPNDNSSSRPWSLQVGIGPSINLESGGAFGKAGLDFQYHFKGGDVGPALGGLFYFHFAERVFGFNVGPIFMWDFRVYSGGKFKLYLAPLIAAGYSLTTVTHTNFVGNAFFLDLGGQLKGMVNDRVGFFVRPATFSMWAGPGGATGFWTALFGVSFSF